MAKLLTNNYSESEIHLNKHNCAISHAKRNIDEMISSNPDRFTNSDSPFVIVELGCADGLNSLGAYKVILSAISNVNQKLKVFIYLNDLDHNDFAKAMTNLSLNLKEKYPNLHIFASVGTFWERTMPEDYVDLFITNYSLFYLSKLLNATSGEGFCFTKRDWGCENGKIWKQ